MNTNQLEARSSAHVKPMVSQNQALMSANQGSKVSFGVNLLVKGKGKPNQLSQPGAFQGTQGTFHQLAQVISAGFPWMPAVLDKGKPRRKEHANYAQLVALDIDGGMTIEEALEHPFIQKHCSLGIESTSSTIETPKFRLIFQYTTPIEGWENIELGQQHLMSLVPQSDPACKDACRFFYGAEGREPFLLNYEATLPEDFLEDAITSKESQLSQEEIKQAALTQNQFEVDGNSDIETVKEALTYIPGRGSAGDNRYPECLKILVCLKARFGEAKALELAEAWSPSDNSDWNVAKRLASLTAHSKGSEIGFIINTAKKYGYTPKSRKGRGFLPTKSESPVTAELEQLAITSYKQFREALTKQFNELPVESRPAFTTEAIEIAVSHLSKFQANETVKSLGTLGDEGRDVELFLQEVAADIVNDLRDRKEVHQLAQLKGHYIWLNLEDDKIFYDHLKLIQVFGDRLKFNTFKKQVELDGKPFEVGPARAKLSIEYNFQAKGKTDFPDTFLETAKRHSYSPVVDYLNEVHQRYGDQTEILNGLAKKYFGQEEEIYNQMLIKTLVGAVVRAMEPGCKMDTALILQGKQGYRKSTFFKILAGGDEYFEDSFSSVGQKDEIMKIHQAWIAEMAELETVFKRKEVSAIKAFLSCTTDNIRPPYGRDLISMPRGGIIVGTTNESEFLSDSTGNRRFWVVPVLQPIPTDLLKEERDRIWSAAMELYKQGYQWWLSEDEDEQASKLNEDFQTSDPWTDMTLNYIKDKEFFTIGEILDHMGMEISRQDKASQMRVSSILKQAGCTQSRKSKGGERIKGWRNPKPSESKSLQHPLHLFAAEEDPFA